MDTMNSSDVRRLATPSKQTRDLFAQAGFSSPSPSLRSFSHDQGLSFVDKTFRSKCQKDAKKHFDRLWTECLAQSWMIAHDRDRLKKLKEDFCKDLQTRPTNEFLKYLGYNHQFGYESIKLCDESCIHDITKYSICKSANDADAIDFIMTVPWAPQELTFFVSVDKKCFWPVKDQTCQEHAAKVLAAFVVLVKSSEEDQDETLKRAPANAADDRWQHKLMEFSKAFLAKELDMENFLKDEWIISLINGNIQQFEACLQMNKEYAAPIMAVDYEQHQLQEFIGNYDDIKTAIENRMKPNLPSPPQESANAAPTSQDITIGGLFDQFLKNDEERVKNEADRIAGDNARIAGDNARIEMDDADKKAARANEAARIASDDADKKAARANEAARIASEAARIASDDADKKAARANEAALTGILREVLSTKKRARDSDEPGISMTTDPNMVPPSPAHHPSSSDPNMVPPSPAHHPSSSAATVNSTADGTARKPKRQRQEDE